uniref:NAD(P)-binding protein n=1 Tax=Photinus pyralis TaxID=7054 RepID=A0A1Y1KIF3_PHOPY
MSMLKGKYALVTGGAQGIGFACVKELLVNGIEGVTLADINKVRGEESTALLKREFGTEKVIFVAADVSKKDQVEGAFKKSIEHWKHLDVVINNAGLLGEQDWKPTLSTNCVSYPSRSFPLYLDDAPLGWNASWHAIWT